MSCERCAEAAASGAKVCGECGQDLEHWAAPDDLGTPPAQTALPDASRVLPFIGGFFLALLLMGIGAAVGGGAAGFVGAIIGAVAAPLAMIVLAKANGVGPLAAGGITAVAVVVIVFGGCIMLLSQTNFH
jgi:hypothetical protein